MERAPASPCTGIGSIAAKRARAVVAVVLTTGLSAMGAAPDSTLGKPGTIDSVGSTKPVASATTSSVVAATASAGAIPDSGTKALTGTSADSNTIRGSRPPPSDPDGISASLHWSIGAGAPAFPQRDRFRQESALRAERDSLSIDQPWDGSQLGFSTSIEAAMRWRFLRPVAGAQWTFWDSRAVLRDQRTNDLLERTWRVDQLVGQVGLDALVPPGLLTIANARDPYVGWRASYGVGRIEGLGRAWAQGGGWQAHVGADVWSFGPFDLGGRFGWSSLAMESETPFARVLYEGQGDEAVRWNGSGIWLELVLRLDSRPRPVSSPASTATKESLKP